MQDRFCWASLQAAADLGNRSLMRLFRHFHSGQAALDAGRAELQQVPKLAPQAIEKMVSVRRCADPDQTFQDLTAAGIKLIMLGDPDYPSLLAEIADPPVLFYLKGVLPAASVPLIALVGTRQATPYGLAVARQIAQELAEAGWGVVSGMARGIDAAAHAGALAGNGYTLAVLGCGINICYPRENQKLRDRIETAGGLISEFPPGASPAARNFPIRNRIISGCALGTIVVEAGEKSGALITAYLSLEQGRDVFAVPGPITSSCSRGSNGLIKQGAKLVETINDVLVEYPYLTGVRQNCGRQPGRTSVPGPEAGKLQPDEKAIFKQLSLDPVHIDLLAEQTGLTVSVVGGLLTMLEVKGLAKRLPGHYFVSAAPVFP